MNKMKKTTASIYNVELRQQMNIHQIPILAAKGFGVVSNHPSQEISASKKNGSCGNTNGLKT